MSINGLNYIGSTISQEKEESFQAYSPLSNTLLTEQFYFASVDEMEMAVIKADAAFSIYSKKGPKERAIFLEKIAEQIEALGEELISRCVAETGLAKTRIVNERNRIVNQLNMFASLLNEGSWTQAKIDTAQPQRTPFPKPDIRKTLIPIGPVAVFGAANFPLAFSTAGGDTASALAAGCPVIFKAHPSHAGTNELVSRAIIQAAEKTNMPDGVFSSLQLSDEDAMALVEHRFIKAVGFTGSRRVGLLLLNAAVERQEFIPVYAVMSSINPVIIMEDALIANGDAIANDLVNSVMLDAGQYCTNPGLILLIDSPAAKLFVSQLKNIFGRVEPSIMVNKSICNAYHRSVERMRNITGVTDLTGNPISDIISAYPHLFTVEAGLFLEDIDLHEEVFGPSTLVVTCKNIEQLFEVISKLDGQLTATIHAANDLNPSLPPLIDALIKKTGRIVFGGYPTGVEVCTSMEHGGPFPSTTDPGSTSVGADAIYRFVRPVAFQNFPDALLPDSLKSSNPMGIWRLKDSDWTKK